MSQVEQEVLDAFREKLLQAEEVPMSLVSDISEALAEEKSPKADDIIQLVKAHTRPEQL